MRTKKGIVTSNKQNKTIVVTVNTYKNHPKYKKRYRVSKKYHVDNPKNKKFYAANGGHPAGLLFNPDKADLEELHSKGTILGIFKDTQYSDFIRDIEPNDQFLLYTDGLTDVKDEADNTFGEDKLYDIVQKYKDLAPNQIIENILNEIYQFAKVETFTDDINMISFKLDT